MEKQCPYCGAPLPREASFCPHCAKSINQRTVPAPPRRVPAKLLRAAALSAAVLCLASALLLRIMPKTYDAMGQVDYTDSDGSYQLLISDSLDRYTPAPTIHKNAGDEERYRFPLNLYINHKDSGANASGIFMQKVSRSEVAVEQPDGSPSPVVCSAPEAMDFNLNAAQVSLIDFTRESASPVTLVWTLHMENGDTIRLRTDFTITPTMIYDYDSETADLSTSAALQSFLDRLAAETDVKDVINIHLPAVTYIEPVIIQNRPFNLIGSEENGKRTTFSGGIQMRSPGKQASNWISYFTGIDFTGSGSGVGLSAANRVWAKECWFSNWKTAALCYGNVWINTTDCVFEHNGIGLHYNSTDTTPSDTHFTDNTFTGNTTAVLLEQVPSDVKMNFGGCVFSGNETDIDNRCEQALDISEAVFQ